MLQILEDPLGPRYNCKKTKVWKTKNTPCPRRKSWPQGLFGNYNMKKNEKLKNTP